MNVIHEITKRIEKRRAENKNPCKNYATEAAAEKATLAIARIASEHFTKPGERIVPARYVVFYVESWGRWVGCVDLTELLRRSTSTGGYLGICKGFFSY